ncbi:MAG: DNA photolyase family protein [Candidatus Caenarcaniphilales bacterium]|jgi:deoxyribodipyrimidine photo-lyase|nr:DNA photolyase family protein [Candidatus Caenarcaniphilales bacterium]
MSKICVWIRNEFRLNDNPALIYALHQKKSIDVIYCHHNSDHNWKLGSAAKVWLQQALLNFAKDLKSQNLVLEIKEMNPIAFFQEKDCYDEIVFNKAFEPALVDQENKVSDILKRKNIKSKIFNGNYLFDPELIKNKQGQPFKVFTPFYKHCLAMFEDLIDSQFKLQLKEYDSGSQVASCSQIDALNLQGVDKPWNRSWQEKMMSYWNMDSKKLIRNFCEHDARKYQEQRDFPALESGTSKISPYLRFGQISPFRIYHEAKKVNANEFIRQLIWREFANYTMFHFPHSINQDLYPNLKHIKWDNDAEMIERWQRGLTGYPIVDAGMRELWATGWMHNRVRMIVGSFLIKDLLCHWTIGAKWFWDTLVDADLANNTMGWQWVAGSGVDASPFFRIFNPYLQTEKFDPQMLYIKKWVPEYMTGDYPLPIVDHDFARKRALAILKQ